MDNTGSRSGAAPAFKGRKYLSPLERQRVIAEAAFLAEDQRLLVETLIWTGARVSEVLMLSPLAFDLPGSVLTLPTLKQRKPVTRDIPLPPDLTARLDRHFHLIDAQRDPSLQDRPLWPISRTTAWRIVKAVMLRAGIAGIRATPRGLRHAFGVASLQAGVPVTLLKRWMGHARLSTTEIYVNVIGEEELSFARRFWSGAPTSAGFSASTPPSGQQHSRQSSASSGEGETRSGLFPHSIARPQIGWLIILLLFLLNVVTGTILMRQPVPEPAGAITTPASGHAAREQSTRNQVDRRTYTRLDAFTRNVEDFNVSSKRSPVTVEDRAKWSGQI